MNHHPWLEEKLRLIDAKVQEEIARLECGEIDEHDFRARMKGTFGWQFEMRYAYEQSLLGEEETPTEELKNLDMDQLSILLAELGKRW